MTTPSAMANIKIFQSLKFYMKLTGIFEVEFFLHNHKIPISLFQRVFILLYTSLCGLSSIWYCLFEADSNYGFIEPFYLSLGHILVMIMYSVLLWKRNEIDHLFDMIEKTIDNRKIRHFYATSILLKQIERIFFSGIKSTNLNTAHQKYFDANECIEKWTSRMFKFGINIFNPLIVVPVLSLYLYRYFTSDFSDNSVRLLFYAS